MDLTICQSCKKNFDQSQRLPKLLSCGCVHCAKCLQKFSQASDSIKCKTHKNQVSIEEQNVKDFNIQEYFMQEMNKFEQLSNLIQVIQELSSQANVHKSQLISIKKSGLNFQKLFNEIVRQVMQILYQKEISGCQKIMDQIEDVLKKMNIINEKYQQIKNIQVENSQQCNSSINELNKLVKEFEGMQTEVQRLRALKYQGSNQNYRIIQEVSFQVFQELMQLNVEQRVFVQDYSVIINRYINQQNILIPNQPVQIIKQSPQVISIESIQQLQNILEQFQNQQIDINSILNNPLNIINLRKKAMILYDLVKLKSEQNQQNLLKILNISKNQPQIQQAAANALTMLNFMNYTLTNQDLSNLNLASSNLSDTSFISCNFSNTNLTQANLCNSKFLNCDFTSSNLTSIITEYPHIFTGHTDSVTSISISSDSEFIVSGSDDKTVRLWDVKTGTSKIMSGHTNCIIALAISSDSKFIVSGSVDKTVRLWDVKTGKSKKLSGHTSYVNSISISNNSQFIVSGSDDKTVRLWDVKTGMCKTMSGHSEAIFSVAISRDSEFIVSGSSDYTVRLWKFSTFLCIKVLKGHSSAVSSVIFSSNNGYIISGSYDWTIRVWDIQSGQQIITLSGQINVVGSLSLSRDGNWLVASKLHYSGQEDNNSFRRWNLGRLLNVSKQQNVIQLNVGKQEQNQVNRDWTSVYVDYGLEFKNCVMNGIKMSVEDRFRYIK